MDSSRDHRADAALLAVRQLLGGSAQRGTLEFMLRETHGNELRYNRTLQTTRDYEKRLETRT